MNVFVFYATIQKVCVISSIKQRKKIYFCPTLSFSSNTYLNQLTVQVLDLL